MTDPTQFTEKMFTDFLELAMQLQAARQAIIIDPASEFDGHTVVSRKGEGPWILRECECHDRNGRFVDYDSIADAILSQEVACG